MLAAGACGNKAAGLEPAQAAACRPDSSSYSHGGPGPYTGLTPETHDEGDSVKTPTTFLAALCLQAATASAATIDQMYSFASGSFGNFEGLILHGFPTTYALSDGSFWDSGAGSFTLPTSSEVTAEVDGAVIRYTVAAPASGVLFEHTDYDNGDHSAQGTLGVAGPLVIVADLGSKTGVMEGYTEVLANDETWYGQPRFNFYTAKVGDKVWFRQTFVLFSETFDEGLFTQSFDYTMSGVVDFTQVLVAVPEPASGALALGGLLVLGVLGRRDRSRRQAPEASPNSSCRMLRTWV